MANYTFLELLKDPYLRDEVCLELLKDSSRGNIRKDDLLRVIEHTHKDLFINFRNRGITLEQLKSRVAERRFGIKYVVLDDLLPNLLDRFKDPVAAEAFRPTMIKIYGENP